jgi:hypothetical protein
MTENKFIKFLNKDITNPKHQPTSDLVAGLVFSLNIILAAWVIYSSRLDYAWFIFNIFIALAMVFLSAMLMNTHRKLAIISLVISLCMFLVVFRPLIQVILYIPRAALGL